MNDERFYELTAKFLAREIAEDEKNELSIILQIKQYNSLFEEIVEKWNKSERDYIKFDQEKTLQNITEKLKEKENSFSWHDSIQTKPNLFYNSRMLKIAASIAFILLALTAYYYTGVFIKNTKTETDWHEKITVSGEKSELILPDNSRIIVNGQSKLKYPVSFNNKMREVYLEGEAYFEISRDSARPFVVHTNTISTSVLGTKFNISAFPRENNIEISLVEGSVKVINEKEGIDNENILLKPMQMLKYNMSSSTSIVENFDLQEKIGWKDNVLKFTDMNLSDVFVKLERAFGIKFELKEKSFTDFKITGNFQRNSYYTICEALKQLTKLKYKIIEENKKPKTVVFFKTENKK